MGRKNGASLIVSRTRISSFWWYSYACKNCGELLSQDSIIRILTLVSQICLHSQWRKAGEESSPKSYESELYRYISVLTRARRVFLQDDDIRDYSQLFCQFNLKNVTIYSRCVFWCSFHVDSSIGLWKWFVLLLKMYAVLRCKLTNSVASGWFFRTQNAHG